MTSLNYQLTRNGVAYASGNAQSKLVTDSGLNPRLEFGGLPSGSYVLSFSQGFGGFPNMLWCEDGTAVSFFLPQVNDAGVNVRVGAGLAGPMNASGMMADSLRAHALVPLTEPYSAAGYTYTGSSAGAATTTAVLGVTGAQAVVDWVVLELRSSVSPHGVVASRPALIRRDGEVIDLDGDAYVNFPGLAAGSYRIALRHRNHLGVMTSSAYTLGFIPERANFRAGGAYGTVPQTSVGSVQCLWPGDCAADGTIRYVGGSNDRDPILQAIGGSVPTNTLSNVYNTNDVNMDGIIRYVGANNDRDVILQTIGGSVPTATRVQQLP